MIFLFSGVQLFCILIKRPEELRGKKIARTMGEGANVPDCVQQVAQQIEREAGVSGIYFGVSNVGGFERKALMKLDEKGFCDIFGRFFLDHQHVGTFK